MGRQDLRAAQRLQLQRHLYSGEFSQHCADRHPFYVKGAAWSPDQSTVYIATTGERPDNWRGSFPLTGLCDVAAAFPSIQVGGLTHIWVNYTGCDSLYAAAADRNTVYVGGHERWADNPGGCNKAGPAAIPAPGMAGFTAGGSLLTNTGGTAGRYSRARGSARTTCCAPPPACGSPATTSTGPTPAVVSPATPGSAFSPTPDEWSGALGAATPRHSW